MSVRTSFRISRWQSFIPAAVVLAVGLTSAVYLSEVFERDRRTLWEQNARHASTWMLGNYTGWLERSYAPVSAMTALFENSVEVTTEEFYSAVTALESRTGAFFLDAVGVAYPMDKPEDADNWRIRISNDPLGLLPTQTLVADMPAVSAALRAGLARPGRITLGAPFAAPGGDASSPVVLVSNSPSGVIATIGILNHSALIKALQSSMNLDGTEMKVRARFPTELGRGSATDVVTTGNGNSLFSIDKTVINAEAEFLITWLFDGSFEGGPDTALADATLWGGTGFSILFSTLIVLFMLRNAEIATRISEATVALRASQEELKQKTDVLEGVLASMRQGVAAFDKNLKLVSWNKQFLKVRDYPDNLVYYGQSFETMMRFDIARKEFGDGDPEEVLRSRMEVARQFLPHDFERRRPDGTFLEVHGGPLPGGGFVSTYVDVTERVRGQQALAEKEEQLRTALDTMSGGLYMLDKDLKLVLCNTKLQEMYHLPDSVCRPGASIEEIVRIRATRGEYGPGDRADLVRQRLEGYTRPIRYGLDRGSYL